MKIRKQISELIKEFHAIKVKDERFKHLTVDMLKEEYSMADTKTRQEYRRDMLLAISADKTEKQNGNKISP